VSNNFPGGLIRKTPVTPAGPLQNGAAPGRWTLAEAAFWTKQGLWPTQGNVLAVEDVFSTWLYTGNSSTQTITNGIDLAGKGGLVWIKPRNGAFSHILQDTLRGAGNFLQTNSTSANVSEANLINSFNANGFTLGSDPNGRVNYTGYNYASWTFRKAPNFFDVVTYTGNGGTQNIAHSLGVAPGMIIVKNTTSNTVWSVWHRSVNGGSAYAVLNLSDAFYTSSTELVWGNNTTYVAPTTTQFTVGQNTRVNQSGNTFVAYLFAHVPGSDGIIQCGSFTTDGSGYANVNLGYEPQWIMYKSSGDVGSWGMGDVMRGMPASTTTTGSGNSTQRLFANTSSAEGAETNYVCNVNSTGFTFHSGGYTSSTFIYVAIRRGPMRTPTLGTSVFYPQTVAQTGSPDSSGVPFPPDLVNTFSRNGTNRASVYDNFLFVDRLRSLGVPNNTFDASTGGLMLASSSTAAEAGGGSSYVQLKADSQNITRGTGWNDPQYGNWIYYFFRRAPGFMDVVCYTGNGVNGRAVNHNLGVAPELVIVKVRNLSSPGFSDWWVYCSYIPSTPFQTNLALNTTDAAYYYGSVITGADPTTFSVSSYSGTNGGGNNYVSYLFASAPGVSKVGTYTGNGSSQTINCAFTTGARFVMIKRTDSTGDWYVWDSARGIVAGNDPYLALNTSAAEVTSNDSVDTDSTGFIVNQVAASNINVNAATYIFLAIA
jgi:hypothetical protein